MKNLNLLINVTSHEFVALLVIILHFNYGRDTGSKIPNADFYAHLLAIESLSLSELLELLSDVELPLLSLATVEDMFKKIQKEYIRLTEYLQDAIENSTGEEA